MACSSKWSISHTGDTSVPFLLNFTKIEVLKLLEKLLVSLSKVSKSFEFAQDFGVQKSRDRNAES